MVLAHGWSGRASQMAPLAAAIAAAGYRAIALDVTGHGGSPGRRATWSDFLRDIPALARECGGEVHACIGHCAGGLAMMAARRAGALSARKYVCLGAPSYPFPPIDVVTRKLAQRHAIVERYKVFIAGQFGATWQELCDGQAFEGAGPETLLIYDRADRFVNHTEGDRIAALARGATLVKTAACGHLRVLGSTEVFEEVRRFLAGNEA